MSDKGGKKKQKNSPSFISPLHKHTHTHTNTKIHPETPAGLLSRRDLETVWAASVRTLRDGFETGSIVTVRDGAREAPFDPAARRFVYNRERCATCGDTVVSFDINARTAYACPSCQPLRKGVAAQLPAARRREAEGAAPAKLFNSRCAPDNEEVSALSPAKMTVAQLRAAAEGCGLETKGKKAELVSRLEEHARKAKAAAATAAAEGKTKREPLDDLEDALAANLSSSSFIIASPGTAGLVPATPAAAAAEKRRAGEKGNVEHVAQAGDDLATARGPAAPKRSKKDDDAAAVSSEGPSAAAASSPVTPAPKKQKRKSK